MTELTEEKVLKGFAEGLDCSQQVLGSVADDLHISAKEAKAFILNYYAKHKAVEELMNKLIQTARETGKATTIFGRTRKMFDINASNYMVRMRAERASQNMPLQGSAADVIKLAMIKVSNALKEKG